MPAPIYVPQRQNPWTNMLPNFLMNMFMMKERHDLIKEERELSREETQASLESTQQFELQKEGYTPSATGTGDVTVGGQAYNRPTPQFSPISINGKQIPGKAIFKYGNSVNVINLPKNYNDYKVSEIPVKGTGENAVVAFPMTSKGEADTTNMKILYKPSKVTGSDLMAAVRANILVGLPKGQQAKAAFPSLKETKTPQMRQLDIYAKAAGVDVEKLRNRTLSQAEAQKVVKRLDESRAKNLLELLFQGKMPGEGTAAPEGNKVREAELLRKRISGTISPAEDNELNQIQGR